MAAADSDHHHHHRDFTTISKTFPVKPKLKPTTRKPTQDAESKYWRSFKRVPQTLTLTHSIDSLKFSPAGNHHLAATHATTVHLLSPQTLAPVSTLHSPSKDVITSASFRSDAELISASSLSGHFTVFSVKHKSSLRHVHAHSRAARFAEFPKSDKVHVFTGGDDGLVKYWDVQVSEDSDPVCELVGHKDYVRAGDASPGSYSVFMTGSYDHTVRIWDVRGKNVGSSVMEMDHGKPVEDVVYLPSGGLVASAGGNVVRIWDVIGGGKLLYEMGSHNKTVTSLCVGKIGKESGEIAQQNRLLSVSLDGYLKVFDFSKFKVTFSMRFPSSLMSVAVSPDCFTRVIGTSNGILYAGKRESKVKEDDVGDVGNVWEDKKKVSKPTYFRYFHRGQNEKPSEGDYLVMRKKKVKIAEHDRLLKKFHHKEALVCVLEGKNPGHIVAVMEELVARKKLLLCVSNLTIEELGLLLKFLQRYVSVPRYSSLLIGLAKKVLEVRENDLRGSDELRASILNLKRSVEEELKVQVSLQEIQGIISPLLKIAGRS